MSEIKKVGIWGVLTELFGEDSEEWPLFEEQAAPFNEWLEENNAFCYSRPRESFFEYEAVELAEEAGAEVVVLEDLS